jgi:Uma2 family endonuclease
MSSSTGVLDHLHRMNVDEFERLANVGFLKDERVELIDGWLVRKTTSEPPHVVSVDASYEAIAGILPNGWWLRDEKPVRIPDFDQPEPDISVVRGSRQDYHSRHPGPGDIEFLIEVSDTSLPWDRREKLAAYARAGVPTYWIVNLIDRQLEVFTSPDSSGYLTQRILGPSDQASVVIEGAQIGLITVADMLPCVSASYISPVIRQIIGSR